MFGHDATKLKGFILIDGKEVAETKCCCHCGMHWVPDHGSGTVRGFCVKCHGHVCGKASCNAHVPLEAKIEHAEALGDGRLEHASRLLSRYPDLRLFPW